MSTAGLVTESEGRAGERLTVGVAARLSQYLRVLTQAKKMGQERISSQEMSEYTNINATQIRRDLSAFGKFGKRGVGYNIDGLIAEIRKILRTQGQHNIALFGAGRLGSAIANSTVFADHGFNIAAAFDTDPGKVGQPIEDAGERHSRLHACQVHPEAHVGSEPERQVLMRLAEDVERSGSAYRLGSRLAAPTQRFRSAPAGMETPSSSAGRAVRRMRKRIGGSQRNPSSTAWGISDRSR